jgi:hypothetical protein
MALATRIFVANDAGVSTASFSWRDPQRAADLGFDAYFPPLQFRSRQNEIETIRFLGQEIANRSHGSLQDIEPANLGFVPGFSAAVYDQIVYADSSKLHVVTAYSPVSLKLPVPIRSLVRYSAGDLQFVIARGSFSEGVDVRKFIASSVRDSRVRWKKVLVTEPFIFKGDTQRAAFPSGLARVNDENGRLDNEMVLIAHLSIGPSSSFAAITQLNYYSPGCCWDFIPTPKLSPNAFLLAYNNSSWLSIYAGYGRDN